jgi:hypothetical protein
MTSPLSFSKKNADRFMELLAPMAILNILEDALGRKNKQKLK